MACSRWSNWYAIATRANRWRRGRRLHPGLRRLLEEALDAGVSFAARGNLILLAPPLVIAERELADALDLLGRLLGPLRADAADGGVLMSFKLTYATMFEPPAALHARFDAAVARVRERLGGRYYLLHRRRGSRRQPLLHQEQSCEHPGRSWASLPPAAPRMRTPRCVPPHAAWPAWRARR